MLEKMTAADLVKKYLALKDHCTSEEKRFNEHLSQYRKEMEQISQQLLDMANTQGCDSFATEHGTAYKSRLMNVKVEDRDRLLDFADEHWQEIGSDLLLISAQKEAVRRWMEENNNQPPPGLKIDWFTRINVRRS